MVSLAKVAAACVPLPFWWINSKQGSLYKMSLSLSFLSQMLLSPWVSLLQDTCAPAIQNEVQSNLWPLPLLLVEFRSYLAPQLVMFGLLCVFEKSVTAILVVYMTPVAVATLSKPL